MLDQERKLFSKNKKKRKIIEKNKLQLYKD